MYFKVSKRRDQQIVSRKIGEEYNPTGTVMTKSVYRRNNLSKSKFQRDGVVPVSLSAKCQKIGEDIAIVSSHILIALIMITDALENTIVISHEPHSSRMKISTTDRWNSLNNSLAVSAGKRRGYLPYTENRNPLYKITPFISCLDSSEAKKNVSEAEI